MLVLASILLVAIGLLSLLSTTQPELTNFYKQIIWLFLGVGLFFIFSTIDYRLFKAHFSPVLFLYFLGLLGLIIVYFFASPIRGARSWLNLGFFNIEPVEPLKIILILILAKYFSMRHVEIYRFKHILISGVYMLLPSLLILIQPDVGSFVVVVSIWIGVMLVSGIRIKHFLILGLVAVLLSIFAWSAFLQDYQKSRISAFINPQADPYGAGYNSIQSRVTVASGGFWGTGFGQGTQSQLGFLPETSTDFIFASIAEEFGMITVLTILVIYGIFFWRIFYIFRYASDNFARITLIGISTLIAVQLFLNIAMTLGIAPITGLPLPFISYGGSSLLTLFMAVGIIQSIYRHSTTRSMGIDEVV